MQTGPLTLQFCDVLLSRPKKGGEIVFFLKARVELTPPHNLTKTSSARKSPHNSFRLYCQILSLRQIIYIRDYGVGVWNFEHDPVLRVQYFS